MKITSNIITLAMLLNTSVDMLMGFAHSQGFQWVNDSSECFYWLNDSREISGFEFFVAK